MDVNLKEIKALHKEWFPVEYHDSYFNRILNDRYKMILAIYDFKKTSFEGTKKQRNKQKKKSKK